MKRQECLPSLFQCLAFFIGWIWRKRWAMFLDQQLLPDCQAEAKGTDRGAALLRWLPGVGVSVWHRLLSRVEPEGGSWPWAAPLKPHGVPWPGGLQVSTLPRVLQTRPSSGAKPFSCYLLPTILFLIFSSLGHWGWGCQRSGFRSSGWWEGWVLLSEHQGVHWGADRGVSEPRPETDPPQSRNGLWPAILGSVFPSVGLQL